MQTANLPADLAPLTTSAGDGKPPENVQQPPALTLDKVLIVEMLTQQGFEYLVSSQPWISAIDKLVLLYMVAKLIQSRRLLPLRSALGLAIVCWAGYLATLVIVRHLPLVNFIQILLSGKFIVFYCYYLIKDDASKRELLRFTLKALLVVVATSLVLSPFELLLAPDFYSEVFDVQRDGRGFNNTFLTSYFHSRSLFASVLLVPLAILLSSEANSEIFKGTKQQRIAWIVAIIGLIYLSFSRKELVIVLLFIGIVMYRGLNIRSRLSKMVLVAALLAVVGFFLNAAFEDVNDETIGNEDYIRFVLWNYGYQIFDTYFPFGSGPGTYGTLFSRYNFDTYINFDVPEYIYLGYGDGESTAPIYDVYIASILAEAGLLGSFLTALILFLMVRRKDQLPVKGINQPQFLLMLAISVLVLLVATPVLTNMIGYLFFGFAGMLASQSPRQPLSAPGSQKPC
jgi:hypothetical protein